MKNYVKQTDLVKVLAIKGLVAQIEELLVANNALLQKERELLAVLLRQKNYWHPRQERHISDNAKGIASQNSEIDDLEGSIKDLSFLKQRALSVNSVESARDLLDELFEDAQWRHVLYFALSTCEQRS